MFVLLILLLAPIGAGTVMYGLYKLIRLAVRNGIEDAWRDREQQAREKSSWDPARY